MVFCVVHYYNSRIFIFYPMMKFIKQWQQALCIAPLSEHITQLFLFITDTSHYWNCFSLGCQLQVDWFLVWLPSLRILPPCVHLSFIKKKDLIAILYVLYYLGNKLLLEAFHLLWTVLIGKFIPSYYVSNAVSFIVLKESSRSYANSFLFFYFLTSLFEA